MILPVHCYPDGQGSIAPGNPSPPPYPQRERPSQEGEKPRAEPHLDGGVRDSHTLADLVRRGERLLRIRGLDVRRHHGAAEGEGPHVEAVDVRDACLLFVLVVLVDETHNGVERTEERGRGGGVWRRGATESDTAKRHRQPFSPPPHLPPPPPAPPPNHHRVTRTTAR